MLFRSVCLVQGLFTGYVVVPGQDRRKPCPTYSVPWLSRAFYGISHIHAENRCLAVPVTRRGAGLEGWWKTVPGAVAVRRAWIERDIRGLGGWSLAQSKVARGCTLPWHIRLKARVNLGDQTAPFYTFKIISTTILTNFNVFLGINLINTRF